jgi:hypothetical protein
MEEHAREKRPVIIQREAHPSRPFGMGITRRYDAKIVKESLQHRLRHHELEAEKTKVLAAMRIQVPNGLFFAGIVSRIGITAIFSPMGYWSGGVME